MDALSSSLVGYMSCSLILSLLLSLSLSLCTITMSKVILSKWHEVRERETISIDRSRWHSLITVSLLIILARMNFSISLLIVWRKANIQLEKKGLFFELCEHTHAHAYIVLKRVQEKEVIYNHHNQVDRKWFIFIHCHKERMNETNGYMPFSWTQFFLIVWPWYTHIYTYDPCRILTPVHIHSFRLIFH